MDRLLTVSNLKKYFETKTETLEILKGINLTLDRGESLSITGESGSGKSTLLNLIGGLDSASSGEILFEQTDITRLDEEELTGYRSRKVGFVFQSHYLLEEFTALENVMLPSLIADSSKKAGLERARHLLNQVGLDHRLHHYPSQLSGGERQRAAIARSLINNPALILADEPTGNLDERNASIVIDLLFRITSDHQYSLILVTHSTHIAQRTTRTCHLELGLLK
jgi:lipoprotein-releasing system ATP-binding protein